MLMYVYSLYILGVYDLYDVVSNIYIYMFCGCDGCIDLLSVLLFPIFNDISIYNLNWPNIQLYKSLRFGYGQLMHKISTI